MSGRHIVCSRRALTMEHEVSIQEAKPKPLMDHGATSSARVGSQPASEELASRRTGMSFQRTRMSADRTLMSVLRTALSLITFGFTISQTFRHLRDAHVFASAAAPHHFGVALVL